VLDHLLAEFVEALREDVATKGAVRGIVDRTGQNAERALFAARTSGSERGKKKEENEKEAVPHVSVI
jgi:hypothetical protein